MVLGASTILYLNTPLLAAQALEEIIVTAQKREQSLQDVPISVVAFDGAQLESLVKTEVKDLARIVPGLTFSEPTTNAGRSVKIRGVGTQSFGFVIDQSVGVVIDGVVASSVAASFFEFSDVERLEVLRGPQGMLFGKNASAGLINITTRSPSDVLSGGANVTYGSDDLWYLNGYVSGPLGSDNLLGLVSAYSNTHDGIVENTFPGEDDSNDKDQKGGRAKIQWLPNDEFDMKLTHSLVRDNPTTGHSPLVEIIPGSVADLDGGEVDPEGDSVFDTDYTVRNVDVDISILEANYRVDELTFTSISSYTNEKFKDRAAADNVGRTALPANDNDASIKQFTQELRLTSDASYDFRYVAGLYFYHREYDNDFFRIIDFYGVGLAPAPGLVQSSLIKSEKTEQQSYAAFGQATWGITDNMRLSLGARYNYEKIEGKEEVSNVPGTIQEGTAGTYVGDDTDSAWSWRIIGEYDLTSSAMVYASVARGYKGPAINNLGGSGFGADYIVDAEIPTNYEVGIKSEWFDERLRANATVYYTEFEDFQASAQVPGKLPPEFFLTNSGSLETQGVEIELLGLISENLLVSSAIAYTDAVFKEYESSPCYEGQTEAQGCSDGAQDLSGADLPNSPDWTVNFSADYTIPFTDFDFDGFVRADYFWTDDTIYGVDQNPEHVIDSYDILDLYAGIRSKDGRYSAQVFVKNAMDDYYINTIGGQQIIGVVTAQAYNYDYKRRFGLQLSMKF